MYQNYNHLGLRNQKLIDLITLRNRERKLKNRLLTSVSILQYVRMFGASLAWSLGVHWLVKCLSIQYSWALTRPQVYRLQLFLNTDKVTKIIIMIYGVQHAKIVMRIRVTGRCSERLRNVEWDWRRLQDKNSWNMIRLLRAVAQDDVVMIQNIN